MISEITKMRLAVQTYENFQVVDRLCEISAMAGYRPRVNTFVAGCQKTAGCNRWVEEHFASFEEFVAEMSRILEKYGRVEFVKAD